MCQFYFMHSPLGVNIVDEQVLALCALSVCRLRRAYDTAWKADLSYTLSPCVSALVCRMRKHFMRIDMNGKHMRLINISSQRMRTHISCVRRRRRWTMVKNHSNGTRTAVSSDFGLLSLPRTAYSCNKFAMWRLLGGDSFYSDRFSAWCLSNSQVDIWSHKTILSAAEGQQQQQQKQQQQPLKSQKTR